MSTSTIESDSDMSGELTSFLMSDLAIIKTG